MNGSKQHSGKFHPPKTKPAIDVAKSSTLPETDISTLVQRTRLAPERGYLVNDVRALQRLVGNAATVALVRPGPAAARTEASAPRPTVVRHRGGAGPPVIQRSVDATSMDEAVQWATAARSALGLSRKQRNALNLKDNAKAVASNLKKLQKTLSGEAYNKLQQEFFEIVGRIHESGQNRDVGGAGLDAKRLEVLRRQTAMMVQGNDKNRGKTDSALQSLGTFLLDQIRTGGRPDMSPEELGTALADHLMKQSDTSTGLQISMDVRAINQLAQNAPPDSAEYKAAKVAAARLTELNQQKMATLGPSKAERGQVERTPSEVMVHLIAVVEAQAKAAKGANAILNALLEQAKMVFLQHKLTVAHVVSFLESAAGFAARNGLDEISDLCDTLSGQMPLDDSKLAPTRLQENLYGRVFDSGVVSSLVKSAPPGVLSAMESSAKAMAAWLLAPTISDDVRKKVAVELQHKFKDEDPRFWFPQVPDLLALVNAGSPDDALAALLQLLRSKVDTGVKAQAVPYVLVKLSLVLREEGKDISKALPGMPTDEFEPDKDFNTRLREWQAHKKRVEYGFAPWMEAGNANYASVVSKQTGRTDAPDATLNTAGEFKAKTPKTLGSGITLLHQPNPFVDNWMVPSVRPTTKNMPNIKPDDKGSTQYPTDSVETALSHGLAYASGVSGSTNIMLHLFEHLKQGAIPGLDAKDFLLGTMMFLVYDGGHSMHEVMWTANQLDKKLGLGLNLGDSDNPTKFVSDYQKFMELYKSDDQDDTGSHLAKAMASAFDDTVDYFTQYSYYSSANK